MEDKTEISELIQLMFVGLMGANREIKKVLKGFHEMHNKPSRSFLFYEYLVHQPLPKKENKFNKEEAERIYRNTWIIHPFSYRLARRSLFMIRPDDAQNYEALYDFFDDEDIAKTDILIKMINSFFTKHIYEWWYNDEDINPEPEPVDDNCKLIRENTKPFIDPQELPNAFFATTEGLTVSFMENIQENIKEMDEISKKSYRILHGIIYPRFSLLKNKNKNKEITTLLIPIASSQIFYGNIFVFVPHIDKEKLKKLASKLLKCVKEHYVPALALIHEHFFEGLVGKGKKEISKKDLLRSYELTYNGEKIAECVSPICRSINDPEVKHCYQCTYFGWEESSDNTVEKYLHKLWQDRKTRFTEKEIKESLLFQDRLYTDPKMLDVLERFLKPSKAKLRNLPSILVVASPGAGKEDIPKLLRLFTDYYDKGKTYKINMASLKPDAIVPMAMAGGEIRNEKDTNYEYKGVELNFHKTTTNKLEGILQKIRKETHDKFEKFIKGELKDKISEYKDYFNERIKKIRDLINEKEDKIKLMQVEEKTNKELLDFLRANNLLVSYRQEPNDEQKAEIEKIFKEENIRRLEKLESEQRRLGVEIKAKEKEIKKIEEEKIELEKKHEMLSGDGGIKDLKISGIEKLIKELSSEEKLFFKELFGGFPTIVLDELNSMNIESQGVLLRFLENSEIMPIGGIEDKMLIDGKDVVDKEYQKFLTDFLVVGLMNEEPEEITRERAIQFLKKEGYIGGLLGDLLYEHIIKIRRLRPDLKARMMRNGIIRIPKLAEHRADIPHTFYNFILRDKGDYFPNSEIRITMDALELLMSPEFEWSENYRLLETLTKKAEEIIYEDYKDKDDKFIIVREKHIREAMKEIGMI